MNDAAHKKESLYKNLLGDSWQQLPATIREMHARTTSSTASGEGSVTRGKNILARIAARIGGFPPASENISVQVHFTVKDGKEIWTRHFGNHTFHSHQYRQGVYLVETFGPLRFMMQLEPAGNKLYLHMRKWSLLGLPLPMFLCPRSDSYEYEAEGKFHFHVHISHPLCGLIVAYHGWLLRTS